MSKSFLDYGCPFFLGNPLYHVGISGGKDSAAALLWMVRESGIDPALIRASFCDIGNDHSATIDHVQWLSENIHPVETIYPEVDFFNLALERKRFPSTKARFCTEVLKIHPTQVHTSSLKNKGYDVIAISGVRADESDDRANLPAWDYSGMLLCLSWRPLLQWTLEDVLAIHRRHVVPMNPLYAAGAQRVGCWPCIMSRKEEIRNIALRYPERIDEMAHWEKRIGKKQRHEYASFFPPNKTPERFHSRFCINKDGRLVSYPTIYDVVRWSMTGKDAKGHYLDDDVPEQDYSPMSCRSGYCE